MCFLCHEVQPGGQIHFVSHDHGYAHASCLATAYFAAQTRLAAAAARNEQLALIVAEMEADGDDYVANYAERLRAALAPEEQSDAN